MLSAAEAVGFAELRSGAVAPFAATSLVLVVCFGSSGLLSCALFDNGALCRNVFTSNLTANWLEGGDGAAHDDDDDGDDASAAAPVPLPTSPVAVIAFAARATRVLSVLEASFSPCVFSFPHLVPLIP